MEWIIFKEFTRRCNTPPPLQKIIIFFQKIFSNTFLAWSDLHVVKQILWNMGNSSGFFLTPSLRWECRIIVAEVFWISYLPRMTNSKAHFYIEKLAMTGLFWLETGIISPAFLRSWPWRLSWEFVWFLV